MNLASPYISKEKRIFIEDIDNSQTLPQLELNFYKLCKNYSFSHFNLITVPHKWIEIQQIDSFGTYPSFWIKRYIDQNYHLCDPVLNCPFYEEFVTANWTLTTLAKIAKTPLQKQFLSEAHDFNIENGLTISLPAKIETRNFLTILNIDSLPQSDVMTLSTAVEIFISKKETLEKGLLLNQLTEEERIIINLKIKNYKNSEIQAFLNLSPSKFYTYQKRICSKLRSKSLQQALQFFVTIN